MSELDWLINDVLVGGIQIVVSAAGNPSVNLPNTDEAREWLARNRPLLLLYRDEIISRFPHQCLTCRALVMQPVRDAGDCDMLYQMCRSFGIATKPDCPFNPNNLGGQ